MTAPTTEPAFAKGTTVYLWKIDEYKTVVAAVPYGCEWAYELEHDGTIATGWREDELRAATAEIDALLEEETSMNNDDRDYYRTKSNYELVQIANEQAMTVELGIVLAERLADATRYAEFDYV
jgi:hypothetical protein